MNRTGENILAEARFRLARRRRWTSYLQILYTSVKWSAFLGWVCGLVIGFVLVASRIFLTGNYNYPLQGLPEGRTAGNFPTIGSPDAPIQVNLFTTFANWRARDEFQNGINLLAPDIRSGKVQIAFYPLVPAQENDTWKSLGGTRGANISALAAFCAQEQGRFWAYADFLYVLQGMYGNYAFLRGRLTTAADALGLEMKVFDDCLDNPENLPDYRLPEVNFEFNIIPIAQINQQYFGNPEGHILWYHTCAALLNTNLPSESCADLPESLLLQGLN